METWIRARVDVYLRHGGKTSRRATVQRLCTILNDIRQHEQGVRLPPQVGRAHLHRYWARHSHLSERTRQDHWYAVRLLWELLDRAGLPPRPPLQSNLDFDKSKLDSDMEELQAKWTFDQGGFAKAVVAPTPMGQGYHLHLVKFGKQNESIVLERQRGGWRVFKSIDAAANTANGIGFRRIEIDLSGR